ncbi:MAG: chromosomal replication initiator protein DnaA [Verrucomicrobiales bacterium]|nr:chromosomal replication initiator protein DnaA [Verrucomicrobiales bacterium]
MQTTGEKVWASAASLLRKQLNPHIYHLWFASLRARSLAEEELTLEVSNDFTELWLKSNYLGLIQDVVCQAAGRALTVRFLISPAGVGNPRPNGQHLPPPPPPPSRRSREDSLPPTVVDFNPRNTFDNFVVGSNNNFAHAACVAVAHNPGKAYNPLFVYGGVGLGKTHLLHAIGHHVACSRRHARIAFVSSEKFTNEYIEAIQSNDLGKFRRRYRHADVLLIDDVQFLENKERIQEEFFHTFNALHDSRRQIVLTCDRPAAELKTLEARLVSRFEWGLVTDLQPPDIEVRLAIARKKQESMEFKLPEPVLLFVAQKIRSNIRRLEGALARICSYCSLSRKEPTIELVGDVLRELLQEESRDALTIEAIQKRVAEHFDLRLADMSSKRRPEHIAFPRQIAMYLARSLTGTSLNTIGEAFGGRDHGTVLHACRLVKDRMEVDETVRQVVSFLERQLMR